MIISEILCYTLFDIIYNNKLVNLSLCASRAQLKRHKLYI